jgi:hypothetical protein
MSTLIFTVAGSKDQYRDDLIRELDQAHLGWFLGRQIARRPAASRWGASPFDK